MLKILVVDDAQEDLLLAERNLRHCKILNPIHLCKSGDACIRYFEENGPDNPDSDPCIVFLDMIMAPTSGVSVMRTLRERNLIGKSIVVILSGITDISLIHEGYQLRARTFLIKPFKSEDVVELLDSLKTQILIEENPQGNVLHWISTPKSKQSSDSEMIRRSTRWRSNLTL